MPLSGQLSAATIAAIATAAGRAGIGVIRISGTEVPRVARAMLGGLPPPRHACLRSFLDGAGEALDRGLALYFPAPHSYTGEHTLELQAHGGPVLLDLLLARALECGARLARPGEFSERAFLNGRLDLSQAEAVADLIDASSERAVKSALRSLDGELGRRVNALVADLIALRVYVEAAIDFPEDEIDHLADPAIGEGLQALDAALDRLRAQAHQGCVLRDGLRVVIAGAPNVGKSSLLNRLAGEDRAIVTEVPGTTRDLLRERVLVDGLSVELTDTAGLRETDDRVERIGVDRATQALRSADLALLVRDDSDPDPIIDESIRVRLPEGLAVIEVRNKIDLTGTRPGPYAFGHGEQPGIALSAATGAGIDALHATLREAAGIAAEGEGLFMARRRHLHALESAAHALQCAHDNLSLNAAGELLAEDLRAAQSALGEITGEVTSEDLLGAIFSSFCIGK